MYVCDDLKTYRVTKVEKIILFGIRNANIFIVSKNSTFLHVIINSYY